MKKPSCGLMKKWNEIYYNLISSVIYFSCGLMKKWNEIYLIQG